MKTNQVTVKSLREAGHLVSVQHYRSYIIPFQRFILHVKKGHSPHSVMNSQGILIQPIKLESSRGETLVKVDLKTGEHYEGITKCSKKDSYNRKAGVRKALGRIISAMKADGLKLSKVIKPSK